MFDNCCVYEVNKKNIWHAPPQTHTGAAGAAAVAVAATVRPRTVLPDITRPDGPPAAFGGGAGLRPLGDPARFGGGRGIILLSMGGAFPPAADALAAGATAEWRPRLVGRPPLGLPSRSLDSARADWNPE